MQCLLVKSIVVLFEDHTELLTGQGAAKHKVPTIIADHELILASPFHALFCPGGGDVIQLLLIHLVFYRLPKGVHSVWHTELRPEMFGVSVGGGNTAVASFFVADDDSVSERVEGILLAEHGEKLNGGLIGAPCHGPSGRQIRADECCSVRIADTGGFTHLNEIGRAHV